MYEVAGLWRWAADTLRLLRDVRPHAEVVAAVPEDDDRRFVVAAERNRIGLTFHGVQDDRGVTVEAGAVHVAFYRARAAWLLEAERVFTNELERRAAIAATKGSTPPGPLFDAFVGKHHRRLFWAGAQPDAAELLGIMENRRHRFGELDAALRAWIANGKGETPERRVELARPRRFDLDVAMAIDLARREEHGTWSETDFADAQAAVVALASDERVWSQSSTAHAARSAGGIALGISPGVFRGTIAGTRFSVSASRND